MEKDIETARRVLSCEADAIHIMSESLGEDFVKTVETCFNAKGRVICAGIGKSGHVARKIAATMASTGTPAQFVHPTEASHGDLGMVTRDDVVIALSRSGETAELSDLIHYTRRFDIPLVAMTAVETSALARASDIKLLIPNIAEACTQTSAPTTSTTLCMALGDALAVALLERRGFLADDFRTFHPGGKLGAMLKTVKDIMRTEEELPLVETGAPLDDGLRIMSDKSWGCVGVVHPDGALAGMITDGDIRRLLVSGTKAETVDDAMTRSPITTENSELASALLKRMNDRKISQVLVVQDSRPVGLVRLHDILRAGVS